MKTIFRSIVTFSFLLYLIGMLLPYFDSILFTEDEIEMLSWSGYGSSLPYSQVYAICAFLITSMAWIGIFFFSSIARIVFILVVVKDFLLIPFSGLSVSLPLYNFIWGVVSILDGAIITMMYLTSVSQYFKKTSD